MTKTISKDTLKIACIGECMVELSAHPDNQKLANLGFAGDTMNTAVYLSRLLDPAKFQVSYLTRLGQDSFSRRAFAFLQSENIQTGHIGQDSKRNIGLYSIDLDEEGERSFTYWRSQSAAREMFGKGAPTLADIGAFDVIFLSAITLAVLPADIRATLMAACGAAREKGRMVAFDSNYRPALWENANTARQTIDQMWANCSVAMPSLDDEQTLFPDLTAGQIVERIASFGVDEVVLKSGATGPHLWPESGTNSYPTAKKVVDTTGAGDSFDAGYLASRLKGADQLTAASKGHALAKEVISKAGAIIPIEQT